MKFITKKKAKLKTAPENNTEKRPEKKSENSHEKSHERNSEKRTEKNSEKRKVAFSTFLQKIVPEKLIGDSSNMNKLWRSAYSTGDPSSKIFEARKKNAELFFLIAFALVISIVLIISNIFSDEKISEIERDKYGGDVKIIESEVTAEFEGETIKKKAQLKIRPEAANTDEIADRMTKLKLKLPSKILGENANINEVNKNLSLIRRDDESGIEISWRSSDESLIDTDGNVNLIDGKKGDTVDLTAYLRLGEANDSVVIVAKLTDPASKEDLNNNMVISLENLIKEIGEKQNGEIVQLPSDTPGGLKLEWTTPKEASYWAIPIIVIGIGYIAYRKRYSFLDKKIKEDRESVAMDFPDFLSKLLLLLNAGMVISSALTKIADDYALRKREGEERYFYEELYGMVIRIRTANAVLSEEFAELALKTGRREVMRFSAILSDNIDKGSALSEKLTQESEMLWNMRKKNAEEKGRIAETKLTFPMVLQLLVIILITIAPTAIQMN